jgi:phosphatidylinositol dimannoside acyltransferase
MSKGLARVRGRLIAAAYALAWWLVCRVPESWGRWAFQQAGDIAWRRQGPSVQVLEGNLRRVIGPDATGQELRALSRAGMSSYARYWFEVFRLPKISRERIVDGMGFVAGEEAMLATLAAGRGVVLALPHMGNWDQAGVWVIAEGVPKITVVAERLEPESLARRFFGFRESLGFEVLPATGGASRFGVLAQRLRQGGLVCLPTERDVTGSGIEVNFFGEKAMMVGGPAALAVQTGAALMPVTLWFKPEGWGAHIHDEIPVPAEGSRREKVLAMMQEVARVFEEGIRAHPEDWHMLQRVFVADLDLARLARAEARAAAAGGDGVGADGNGTSTGGDITAEGNGTGTDGNGTGTARSPGEMAGGPAALDGQPNGSGP